MTNRKLNLSKVFRKLKFGKDLDLRVSPPGGGGVSAEISLLKEVSTIFSLLKEFYHFS